MQVWIVQYSKNNWDDIMDSSIHGVYDTEEQAKQVCKYENEDTIKHFEHYHYYYYEYQIHTALPLIREVTKDV